MTAWNLDDTDHYFKLLAVTIPHAFTWGTSDLAKREAIRRAMAPEWPTSIPQAKWWAFRLFAHKSNANWDVENIPKLVIDAFSLEQILKDRSAYPRLGLYDTDTISHVRMVQVAGVSTHGEDFTVIEIFGAR